MTHPGFRLFIWLSVISGFVCSSALAQQPVEQDLEQTLTMLPAQDESPSVGLQESQETANAGAAPSEERAADIELISQLEREVLSLEAGEAGPAPEPIDMMEAQLTQAISELAEFSAIGDRNGLLGSIADLLDSLL